MSYVSNKVIGTWPWNNGIRLICFSRHKYFLISLPSSSKAIWLILTLLRVSIVWHDWIESDFDIISIWGWRQSLWWISWRSLTKSKTSRSLMQSWRQIICHSLIQWSFGTCCSVEAVRLWKTEFLLWCRSDCHVILCPFSSLILRVYSFRHCVRLLISFLK